MSERNVFSLGMRAFLDTQNSRSIKCSVNNEGKFKIQSILMKGTAGIFP